jgi:hypothetical protein
MEWQMFIQYYYSTYINILLKHPLVKWRGHTKMLFSTGAVIIGYDENYNGPKVELVMVITEKTNDNIKLD